MSPSSASYKLEVVSDATQLARECAERIAALIDLALDERDRAHIALSGGTTPAAAYRVLNKEHLPWNRVDVVLGDERWVPPSDPASNARMLRDTLLAECDWVVAKAVEQNAQDNLGIQIPVVWLNYRQALRDIPQQAGFPTTIVWPVKP